MCPRVNKFAEHCNRVYKTFLFNTLSIGSETVRRMIKGDIVVPQRVPKPQSNAEKKILDWIQLIPMMESHYARQKSEKKYVSQDFQTMNKFFKEYKRHSEYANLPFVKKTKFYSLCKSKKNSIFTPKKDLCDKCVQYKCEQMSKHDYDLHIAKKNLARVSYIL